MKRLLLFISISLLLAICLLVILGPEKISKLTRSSEDKKQATDLLYTSVKALPASQPCENLAGYRELERIEYENQTSAYLEITQQKISRYLESCAVSRGFLDSTEARTLNSMGYDSYGEFVKEKGFSDVKQAREATKLGFSSAFEYTRALDITPEKYDEECKVNFSTCKDKKVVWYVREDSDSATSGRRLRVVDSCTDQQVWFTVDGDMGNAFVENRCSRILATLVKDNWLYDDIKVISVLETETKAETEKRVSKMEQDRLFEMAKEKEKLAAELELHKMDARWMASKYRPAISQICAPEVEKLAKYDFEWTGGWTAPKFPQYVGKVKEAYVLTITGDAIKFQNGFGAFRKTTYYCDYNLKTDEYRVYTR